MRCDIRSESAASAAAGNANAPATAARSPPARTRPTREGPTIEIFTRPCVRKDTRAPSSSDEGAFAHSTLTSACRHHAEIPKTFVGIRDVPHISRPFLSVAPSAARACDAVLHRDDRRDRATRPTGLDPAAPGYGIVTGIGSVRGGELGGTLSRFFTDKNESRPYVSSKICYSPRAVTFCGSPRPIFAVILHRSRLGEISILGPPSSFDFEG